METKKTVKFFSVVDWEKVRDYLREMHRQGWKFVRLTALCVYHFEKCEPEDVIYQLDYNADGLAHRKNMRSSLPIAAGSICRTTWATANSAKAPRRPTARRRSSAMTPRAFSGSNGSDAGGCCRCSRFFSAFCCRGFSARSLGQNRSLP